MLHQLASKFCRESVLQKGSRSTNPRQIGPTPPLKRSYSYCYGPFETSKRTTRKELELLAATAKVVAMMVVKAVVGRRMRKQ